MKTLSLKTFPWTAAALALGMPFAVHSAMAAEPWSMMQSSQQTAPQGYGPGMMYNWIPERRRQYWNRTDQRTGYGPGMMMGPPAASSR